MRKSTNLATQDGALPALPAPSITKMRVVVRFRPLNDHEQVHADMGSGRSTLVVNYDFMCFSCIELVYLS